MAATRHNPVAWTAPISCACFAALIVRRITISTPSKRKRVRIFEALVTILSILLTDVIVFDRGLGVMSATMLGVGIGGLGVGVITFTKLAAATMITNLAKSMLATTGNGIEWFEHNLL